MKQQDTGTSREQVFLKELKYRRSPRPSHHERTTPDTRAHIVITSLRRHVLDTYTIDAPTERRYSHTTVNAPCGSTYAIDVPTRHRSDSDPAPSLTRGAALSRYTIIPPVERNPLILLMCFARHVYQTKHVQQPSTPVSGRRIALSSQPEGRGGRAPDVLASRAPITFEENSRMSSR